MTHETQPPEQPDTDVFDQLAVQRRLDGASFGGEVVELPTEDYCQYEEQIFMAGAIINIEGARVICTKGVWKPFGHSLPPIIDADMSEPFANEAQPGLNSSKS